ncbi:MAG: sensor histidine kinase, partial [Chloroflexota bacterium]
MLTSLRTRLWMSYFLALSLVVVLLGGVMLVYLLRNPATDRRELVRLRLAAGLIAQRGRLFGLEDGPTAGAGTPRLQIAAERADETLGARVALFDSAGKLLVDSRQDQAAGLPPLAELRRPNRPALPLFRDAKGRQWLYTLADTPNGALLVAAPRPRLALWSVVMDEFFPTLLRGAAIAVAISLLMGWQLARWISAPLQRLEAAARSLARGEFHELPLEGPREVQVVAGSFNEMVRQVQSSQRAQRDLVANVSHDLKTPLTSVQGFAQAILDGTAGDPPAVRQAAQVIYDEAGRMHRLVLDLLDLARLDAGTLALQRAPLDLAALLEGVAQKFAPQARSAGVDLRFDPPAAAGLVVLGDADRLAQVFSNLLDNALKFTPSGGQVQVSAGLEGGLVEARVADSGPGLPPGELERVFERFYQADKARPAAGRRSDHG